MPVDRDDMAIVVFGCRKNQRVEIRNADPIRTKEAGACRSELPNLVGDRQERQHLEIVLKKFEILTFF